MVLLKNRNSLVKVGEGELLGYAVSGHEYLHQKGNPGWRNTDTEMFPIIGPTQEAHFRVQTPKGDAIQDQHGLLRELNYTLVEQTETKAIFRKVYKARTLVKNSKYPDKSSQQWLSWPYDFQFLKDFKLGSDTLEITFTISGEKDMAFMLGYHPAFLLQTKEPLLKVGDKTITLSEVLAVGNRALHVPHCETITLVDKKEITITTEGFGSFMLWTEVPNMVCIEPITFYPYDAHPSRLHDGLQFLNTAQKVFKVTLSTRNRAIY